MQSEWRSEDFSEVDLDGEFMIPSHFFTNCMCRKVSEVNYIRLEDNVNVRVEYPRDLLVFVKNKTQGG